MCALGSESVLIGHVSHGVLNAIRAQVRVASLPHKHICVSDVLQGALVSGSDSVGCDIAQGVLAVLVVHLGVLQDRDVASVGAGEDSDGANGQKDELKGIKGLCYSQESVNDLRREILTSFMLAMWIDLQTVVVVMEQKQRLI